MVESDRMLNQPESAISAASSEQSSGEHPVATGISVVSGGLAGAVIGNFVGGRLGAAIGAVVGGVAGVALSKEAGDEIEQAVDKATQSVQSAAAEVKPQVESAAARVQERVQSVQDTVRDRLAATEPAPTDLPASDHSVDEQYEQGLALGKQGNLVGAISAFQAVIEREPEYAEAHYNLGVVLGRHGLQEQGIAHIRQAQDICQRQGRDREAHNIAEILHRLGVA